ncbi:alpha/beta hydrolase family protein [Candidatus Latescibacterota bacterium]
MRKINESPVVFKNDGMQIVGMLHKPDTDNKPPAVVFFHGCTTTKTEAHWIFVELARALADSGIMVLRFDFRHSGDSEGNFEEMTLSGEISDALKSVDFLISVCSADETKIGILGMSMGGAIAACTSGRLKDKLKACVLINPVGKPFEDISTIASSGNVDTSSFPIEWDSHLFGRDFVEDIVNIKPLEDIEKSSCPVLIIYGSDDNSVSPERAKGYFEVVNKNGRDAELYVIEGADHVFTTVEWKQNVIHKTNEWLGNILLTL